MGVVWSKPPVFPDDPELRKVAVDAYIRRSRKDLESYRQANFPLFVMAIAMVIISGLVIFLC